jgi:hypothetical protein
MIGTDKFVIFSVIQQFIRPLHAQKVHYIQDDI